MSAARRPNKEELRLFNLQTANFDGVGEYGIPPIAPTQYVPVPFIPFSDAAAFRGDCAATGIHFFLDDYRFARVWNSPERYIPMLRRFSCVCSPDFSLFVNTPKAIQIFNHYRKHWCAAYWQWNGINVIPTICWSDADSFAWCFDGEPVDGAVAVSSVGVMDSNEKKALFLQGYREMTIRLRPSTILHYGKPMDEIAGEVIAIDAFQEKYARMRAARRKGGNADGGAWSGLGKQPVQGEKQQRLGEVIEKRQGFPASIQTGGQDQGA